MILPPSSLFAFDDATAAALAETHGTPCFAYRASEAISRFRRLRAALPERVTLAYAVKANPHPELLRAFAPLGAAFDCASAGELHRVADLAQDRIFYTGPGKRRHELALALELGARVQAESWEDLATLDDLAKGEVAVNLRVHPLEGPEEENRIIGGTGPSAFGIDEEAVPALLERIASLRHIRIRGLHVFAASNERSAEKLLATHAMVLNLAQRLHREHGLVLDQIDLGGGLGVAYAADEPELNPEALGQGLADLLTRHDWFEGQLILEPGRFLAAACGVYLSRVVRVKESRGTRFVILEGGVNHLLRPLLTGQPFPVRAVGKTGAQSPATLAGPLCTSLDRLGDVYLPEVGPGDLVMFGRTGAYGFTEAMAPFLSHPVPEEVWVD